MDGSSTSLTDNALAPAPLKSAKKQGRVEMTVSQIIEHAEHKPAPMWGTLLASVCSGLILWASFPPLDWSALAWLAPLPWLMLIRLPQAPRGLLTASYLGGLCFTLPALQWMRYGDPLMYFGWIALACYLAVYIPLFIGLSRIAVHRWGIPLLVTAPVVWTGLEYLRGFLMTGFGWYYLGHTQYRWLDLIQISDLIGAYGVSFLMMTFAAAVALQIPTRWFQTLRLLPPFAQAEAQPITAKRPLVTLGLASLLLVVCLTYGSIRLAQAEFTPGPRIALIQGNFRAALKIPPSEYQDTFLMHNELTGYAVKEQPDLIVWPEGMFRYSLLEAEPQLSPADLTQIAPFYPPESWQSQEVRQTLRALSDKAGAAMVIGLGTFSATSDGLHQYNSAQLITPENGLQTRYDKLHRVPFGEYIPGKDWLPVVSSMVPDHFGLTAGQKAAGFQYQNWQFAPIICFEDTVPHVTRRIVRSIQNQPKAAEPVDFLVNLSNDGWFNGSSEHEQHLITALFRSVELRKPLVRAANMGISSFVDGNGAILEPEVFLTKDAVSGQPRPESFRDPKTGKMRRKLEAVLVHNLPLDHRQSVYLWAGDWFAQLCLAACTLLFLSRWIPKQQATTPEAATT